MRSSSSRSPVLQFVGCEPSAPETVPCAISFTTSATDEIEHRDDRNYDVSVDGKRS